MMQKLNYIRCGDYYIPDIRLPEETRPIGRWGRMHRDYIKEHNPIRFNDLCLSGELWTYLADLNEQAQNRLELIIEQMKAAQGVTEGMKQHDQMAWVGAMNSIRNRAEEIILREMICEGGDSMRILEEFWYGNIEPTEYDTSSCKEYKKLLELICRNEEKLKATMTDEQKELFERYTDCVREHQTNTDCLIFQNGFKLGARMMLEIMEE